MIVDDHAIVRMGIRRLLEDLDKIDVICEAESGEQALSLLAQQNPDVVLLDMQMPGIGGIETTKRMLRLKSEVKIIVLTAFDSDPFPQKIIQAGAMGYLTKECGVEEMADAIRKVSTGEHYLSPKIAQQLALSQLNTSPFEKLSERELQVMLMITQGDKVQDIADKLCVSAKTVNSYRYRLFEKLQVKNDVELTHLALIYGILDKPGLQDTYTTN